MIFEGGANLLGDAPATVPPVFQNIQATQVVGGSSSSQLVTTGGASNPAVTGTQTVGAPTSTETKSMVLTGSAVGSGGENCGFGFNQAGGGDGIAVASSMVQCGMRVKLNLPASVRWFVGLIDNNNAMNADNPNTTLVCVRFSSGVDTNWTFRVGQDNVTFTEVDTGIPPDATASHTYEFLFNPGGGSGIISSISFIYDGKPIKTISSTLPLLTATVNNTVYGGNKTVANALVCGFFWQYMIMRR